MNVPPAKIHFPEADRQTILERIGECLETGQLTLGKFGRELEAYLADYLGVAHAITVNSGTSALEIPLRTFDVTGREVIIPANTFFATALAVMHAGGRVRFADIDPETLGLDMAHLSELVTEDTGAIVTVHIGGIVPPDVAQLQSFCSDRGISLLEDAAHALGSSLNGVKAGTFGDAAAFSFYPTKIVTSGEGGVIATNAETIDREARLYRDQGKASFSANVHGRVGYNWRMSEPHAVIGLSHCQRLDEFVAERQALAGLYDAGLNEIDGVEPLAIPAGCSSNYYKYIALLEEGIDRAALKQELKERHGVGLAGEVYERPVHLQPYFVDQQGTESLPRAEEFCRWHICLPLYQRMETSEVEQVLNALGQAIGHNRSIT